MATITGESSYLVNQHRKFQGGSILARILIALIAGFGAANTVDLASTIISISIYKIGILVLVFTAYAFVLWYLFKLLKLTVRSAKRYLSGKVGEDSVAKTLSELPESFVIYRDCILPGKKGNIDFVVAGPNKIFAIEVKNHAGAISMGNGQLKRDGRFFEKDFIIQANNQAKKLKNFLLGKGLPKSSFIEPILVFANYRANLDTQTLLASPIKIIELKQLNNFLQNNTSDSQTLNHLWLKHSFSKLTK